MDGWPVAGWLASRLASWLYNWLAGWFGGALGRPRAETTCRGGGKMAVQGAHPTRGTVTLGL